MEETIRGNLGVASSFQLTEQMEALDQQSKNLLQYKEVLAVILKHTVDEYADYSVAKVMDFIDADSISTSTEVSRDRTNTRIEGSSTEFAELSEKTTFFDLVFRAKNPRLTSQVILVRLRINLEAQKEYRPGYPIEKRGIYYLARMLSSQLNLLTEQTDYGQLEKCYSIWICRDHIPKREQMSISYYGISNFKNVGSCSPRKEDYDLLQLVVIRLGDRDYQSEGEDVLEFLSTIFYPHKEGFRKKIAKYIDLDSSLQEQEVDRMSGLGESIFLEGIEEGREKERINTERERQRANAAEGRANAAEEEIHRLQEEIRRMKETGV